LPPRKSDPVFLFHTLHRTHQNVVVSEMSAQGLQDVGQPMILVLLERCENGEIACQKDLAEELHVSPATIATSLKSLERMGYVKKLPDAADARRNRVSVTEKGRDAVARCNAVFDKVDQQLYAGFTPEELDTIQQYHRRMLDNLRNIDRQTNQNRKEPCL
jgi:DNA-binding MarR family transcriptional regulator